MSQKESPIEALKNESIPAWSGINSIDDFWLHVAAFEEFDEDSGDVLYARELFDNVYREPDWRIVDAKLNMWFYNSQNVSPLANLVSITGPEEWVYRKLSGEEQQLLSSRRAKFHEWVITHLQEVLPSRPNAPIEWIDLFKHDYKPHSGEFKVLPYELLDESKTVWLKPKWTARLFYELLLELGVADKEMSVMKNVANVFKNTYSDLKPSSIVDKLPTSAKDFDFWREILATSIKQLKYKIDSAI